MSWPFRLILIAAGFLLIDPGIQTTLIGFGISATVIVLHTLKHKRDKKLQVSV
jgi:UPF0716 family protein affecting phage T7 exclusion